MRRVFGMMDFNGLFGGALLAFLSVFLVSRFRQLSFLPFDPLYVPLATGALALLLITRGKQLVIEGDQVCLVYRLFWLLPIGRKEYPPGTFQKVRVRPIGSEGNPACFVELVGSSTIPLTQASPQQAEKLARELGAALGIPAES